MKVTGILVFSSIAVVATVALGFYMATRKPAAVYSQPPAATQPVIVPEPGVLVRAAKAAIPCPDSASDLALDRLFPQLGMGQIENDLGVWLSGNYTDEFWQPKLRAQQKKLDDLRTWASGINDSCARSAYLGWIDFYQRDLNSAKSELTTRAQKKEMDNYDREQKEQQSRTKRYAAAVDGAFPVPPRK